MQREEQCKIIRELKSEINRKLQKELNFLQMKELVLWMVKSIEFQRLYKKDNQLRMFKLCTDIWLNEKKHMDSFETKGDIFFGVQSLEDVERKILAAKLLMFRLENNVPYELCKDIVDEVMAYQYSPYALSRIAVERTEEPLNNLLKLSEVYKIRNDLVRAIGLLQCAEKIYEDEKQIYLNLADCWLMIQEYNRAYEYLCKIANPNTEIQNMIVELEKIVKYEGIQ